MMTISHLPTRPRLISPEEPTTTTDLENSINLPRAARFPDHTKFDPKRLVTSNFLNMVYQLILNSDFSQSVTRSTTIRRSTRVERQMGFHTISALNVFSWILFHRCTDQTRGGRAEQKLPLTMAVKLHVGTYHRARKTRNFYECSVFPVIKRIRIQNISYHALRRFL